MIESDAHGSSTNRAGPAALENHETANGSTQTRQRGQERPASLQYDSAGASAKVSGARQNRFPHLRIMHYHFA
jgi:hypothetical protein